MPTTNPKIICADSTEWMRTYSGAPFDAVITDPPYGIAFMGRDWDSFPNNAAYREWCRQWMTLLLQVVRPGAHAAIFGSPKLFGHQAVALEDAGWELRDTLSWLYGQGFPKSHNLRGDKVLYGLADTKGVPRCECGAYSPKGQMYGAGQGDAAVSCEYCGGDPPAPADKNGWGTALKPAWEPILLARAPLAGTVQNNYDSFGTGAINIEAARIALDDGEHAGLDRLRSARCSCGNYESVAGGFYGLEGNNRSTLCRHCGGFPLAEVEDGIGRWPANVILDETAAAQLDASTQVTPAHGASSKTSGSVRKGGVFADSGFKIMSEDQIESMGKRAAVENGNSNPSRFFYVAKASTQEREAGMGSTQSAARHNEHPTVKPIELGRWLTRMIVPEGGRVLDPFAGSGSFGIAAGQEDAEWIGIERDEKYAATARQRIAHWFAQLRLL